MDTKEDFFLSEEVAEWIGLKKSELLSELILKARSDDFGFEEFHLFDHLIPQTLQGPDRAYDDKSDAWVLRTYVRTYQGEKTFHHLVIAALIPDKSGKDVLVPVLSFVTKSHEMVKEWIKGDSLPRLPLN